MGSIRNSGPKLAKAESQVLRRELLTLLRASEIAEDKGWRPSQVEIQEACLRIQQTWSKKEREKRNQFPMETLTVRLESGRLG